MATVNAMPIKRPTRTMTKSSRISLLEPLLYLRRRLGPPLPERLGKGHLEAFSAGHHDPEVVRDAYQAHLHKDLAPALRAGCRLVTIVHVRHAYLNPPLYFDSNSATFSVHAFTALT